ncbi:hypothetical protein SONE68_4037 (plasmid) [Lacticaseibacillus paracasei]|nr:hypothetical protein SONE68_4037 [Lacticaseibacillus paracasei]
MPSRVSPGIVNVTDFVAAHAKKFGSYINYIDRDEAIRIDHFDQQNILSVDGYNHYMENPKKSSGIFTDQYDHLTPTQRVELKKQGKNVNGPDKNCTVLPNAYGCHLNSRIIRSFISV